MLAIINFTVYREPRRVEIKLKMMDIKELRIRTGMTQKEFAKYFNIPKRTIENWEGGQRTPPPYVVELIEYKIRKEKLGIG